MRIGELAAATGVEVDTIRYYEKCGMLAPPDRQDNGYRTYGAAHLERLSFIRHCRALDMPLADVGKLLTVVSEPSSSCDEVNELIDEQLLRVRARLKSMRALEKQLTALRRQCAAPHGTDECGILHELVSAARGEACACHA